MSPPPSLPCRAFATAPGDNVSVPDFGADLTDDESCFSVESNPTNAVCQEMAEFLWQCGFPMCASEAQVDSVEEEDVVKQARMNGC